MQKFPGALDVIERVFESFIGSAYHCCRKYIREIVFGWRGILRKALDAAKPPKPRPTITPHGFRASAELIELALSSVISRRASFLKLLRTGIWGNRLAEFAPDTGQVPTIFVVVIETAEVQGDTIEASEISSADRARPCGCRMHHFFLKLLGA